MPTRAPFALAVSLAVTILAGCQSPAYEDGMDAAPDTGAAVGPPAGARALPVEPIGTDRARPVSGFTEARRLVVRTAEEWARVWERLVGAVAPVPPAPQLDFGENMVLVAALGQRPTGGYAIAIDSAYVQGDTLYAVVVRTAPGASCVTTQALTSPATAVRVPATGLPVEFVERSRVAEC